MRKLFLVLFCLGFALTLVAQDKPAAPAPGAPAVDATHAMIFVYRHKQFAGSGLEPSVYLDENQVARMDNGRFFVIKVAPGKHTIRSNDKQSGIEMELVAGKSYYVKVEIATGFWKGHGRLLLMQPEQATYEVKKLEPLGKDKIVNKEMVMDPPPTVPAAG